MLDISDRLDIAAAPGVRVYRDHEDRMRFFAWPSAPRIARNDDGQPDISLLLYGRKQDGGLQISGGQLTLVTSLALTPDEQARVQAGLVELIETENPRQPGSPPPPPPSVFAPEWLTAAVEVDLGHGLRLEGMPSMMADNKCALNLTLTGDQAKALREDWDAGLKDVVLRYRGEVSSVEQASGDSRETSRSFERDLYRTRSATSDLSRSFRASRPTALPLTLEGHLQIPVDELRSQIEVIAL